MTWFSNKLKNNYFIQIQSKMCKTRPRLWVRFWHFANPPTPQVEFLANPLVATLPARSSLIHVLRASSRMNKPSAWKILPSIKILIKVSIFFFFLIISLLLVLNLIYEITIIKWNFIILYIHIFFIFAILRLIFTKFYNRNNYFSYSKLLCFII